MFNLDKKIDEWCQSVQQDEWYGQQKIDELKDHLYCEIDHLQQNGMKVDQAFYTAIKRMGDVRDLKKEYSKNRSFWSTLIERVYRSSLIKNEKKENIHYALMFVFINITISVLFASLIIYFDTILEGTPYNQPIKNTLLYSSLIINISLTLCFFFSIFYLNSKDNEHEA